jgi:hypothetical protein
MIKNKNTTATDPESADDETAIEQEQEKNS